MLRRYAYEELPESVRLVFAAAAECSGEAMREQIAEMLDEPLVRMPPEHAMPDLAAEVSRLNETDPEAARKFVRFCQDLAADEALAQRLIALFCLDAGIRAMKDAVDGRLTALRGQAG